MAAIATPKLGDAFRKINRDILATLDRPKPGYWVLLFFAVSLVGWGAFAFCYQTYWGLGVAGYAPPVMWAVYITNFVFWVGIAHAGTLISAILYLFRAKWRASVNRSAEAMTVFAVMTAGLFPMIHLGRVWKFYYLMPYYPNRLTIWPNFKSPLVWDVFAVSTYFTISSIFLFVGLIPDTASARDRCTDWRKPIYTVLSLGWQGTSVHWRHYNRAYIFLAALATPLVLSVHSVVSWDFAMSIVPGWHTTIFAPYFVAGAIFSGLGMVLTILVPLRKILKMEEYITLDHMEGMAKLVLLTSTIVFYSYLMEFFIAYYCGEPVERASTLFRLFGHYWWATWTMLTCNAIIPLVLWFKSVRRNTIALFIVSIFVNIGMWFERFVIIVTSLSHEYEPAMFRNYSPTWIEYSITAASFAWWGMYFLLFIKFLPAVSIAEYKELIAREAAEAHA
ncbi:MAG: hydrogenase [Deltaproteobacteria bacterium RBG_13_65_10]|jgi:molybdopterin-containing oxidoreductase family membrane subunit|nr:MAG: hydrogenase [Deltaproteobacteria bacterium RBG_13_65_10]